jgi:hypothetical protein
MSGDSREQLQKLNDCLTLQSEVITNLESRLTQVQNDREDELNQSLKENECLQHELAEKSVQVEQAETKIAHVSCLFLIQICLGFYLSFIYCF